MSESIDSHVATSSPRDPETRVQVLCVDDHAMFRAGLSLMLREANPAVTVDHASTLADGIERLRTDPAPKLILTDVTMPDASGLMAIRELRRYSNGVPVVVVSATDDDGFVRRCISAGAAGYVTKSQPAEELRAALVAVGAGRTYLPPAVATAADATSSPSMIYLTARQSAVLEQMERGLSNKEIARVLHISSETVKKHVQAVLIALGVHSRAELIVAAPRLRAHGILMPRMGDVPDRRKG